MRRTAFTLTEALIGITIALILWTMIVPVLSVASGKPQTASRSPQAHVSLR